MKFTISFEGSEEGSDFCLGNISLGEHSETFRASLRHFSRSQYERQWEIALQIILKHRRPTALFQSIDLDENGLGTLWLYPVIASEYAGDTDYKRLRLSDFPEREDAGVYIGERLMPVTVKASNFENRVYEEFEDGTKGDELALYFLDLSVPERIFGYLDENIAHCSHWYYSNVDLENFLSSL